MATVGGFREWWPFKTAVVSLGTFSNGTDREEHEIGYKLVPKGIRRHTVESPDLPKYTARCLVEAPFPKIPMVAASDREQLRQYTDPCSPGLILLGMECQRQNHYAKRAAVRTDFYLGTCIIYPFFSE
jgi:hypothetical protein